MKVIEDIKILNIDEEKEEILTLSKDGYVILSTFPRKDLGYDRFLPDRVVMVKYISTK